MGHMMNTGRSECIRVVFYHNFCCPLPSSVHCFVAHPALQRIIFSEHCTHKLQYQGKLPDNPKITKYETVAGYKIKKGEIENQ